jgi:hypothetical protein
MSDETEKTEAIRIANDILRSSFLTGNVVGTRGFASLEESLQSQVILAIQRFNDFDAGNDPYGEHDFGAVTVDGTKVLWKIDYYDPEMMGLSEDASDPTKTRRVITIMLAEEY